MPAGTTEPPIYDDDDFYGEEEDDDQEPEREFGGPGNPDLPEDLQSALKDLLRKALQREMYARRTEVMEARRQRFYDRGVQYIYWNYQAGGFSPLVSGSSSDNSVDQPRYNEVYNIYHPFLRTLVATLTQKPAAANIVPRSAKTNDQMAAEAAEKFREYIERANDFNRMQMEVSRLQCTDGRVVSLIKIADPDVKFGTDEQGEPLSGAEVEFYGVLESKVPITQNEKKDWTYCVLSREYEIEAEQERWPEAVNTDGASRIIATADSDGETAYERMARIGVLQGTKLITATGETWQHLATRHTAFFRPAFFRAAPKDKRERLAEIFPEGCKLIVSGSAYCESSNCSLDDYIEVSHSTPGDGQQRSSLLHDLVPIQDTFNDLWNQQKEIFDYCIPEVYMDAATRDVMALQENRSEPGDYVPVVLAPGEDIRQKILFQANVEVPQTMIAAMQTLSGELAQLITAALPALMGTGDEHNETRGGIAILREQALGQIGIAWGAQQTLLANSIVLAIRATAKDRGEGKLDISVSDGSRTSTEQIDIADILKGDFYAEVDTTYPDTKSMKRQIFNSLLTLSAKSPALTAILQLPENQKLFRDMTALDDLEIPGADADNQQMREIEEMLAAQPVMPTPQEMQQALQGMAQKAAQAMQANPGLPAPPPPDMQQLAQSMAKPSVPIDPVWDNHALHAEVVSNWLASDARYQEEEQGNQAGIENVKLHGAAHKAVLAQQAQPPAGKPPSVSINFADMPPDSQQEALKEAGIPTNPAVQAIHAIAKNVGQSKSQGESNVSSGNGSGGS
jgi:hypothetical protein